MSRRESNKEAFLHWFAGFLDGEGTFVIRARVDKNTYSATVAISLRDDDLAVLLRIKEALNMGTIHHHKYKARRSKPRAVWEVSKIDDLVRLVKILDSHPLRSKKSADYAIWREAVLEISRGSRGRVRSNRAVYDRRRLERLRRNLTAVKAYDRPETEGFEVVKAKDVDFEVVKVKDVDNEYFMTIPTPPPNK